MEVISEKLAGVIPGDGLVLILGGTGSGKSVLGYGLLEKFHRKGKTYVYGLPIEKSTLLPDDIRLMTTIDFPENSIILCDEAYISFYSRQPMSERNKFMDVFAGLVRQKNILAIYITQSSRKLDVGIVAGAQAVLIKKPSLLQMKLDRSELRSLLEQANRGFRSLRPRGGGMDSYQKKCTYVVSDSFEGMIEGSNLPPSFWSEELSKAYAGVPLDSQRAFSRHNIKCISCNEDAIGVCSDCGNSYCEEHSVGHHLISMEGF